MSSDPATPTESGGVQDFIRERQVGVLERAITSLRECSDADLVAETHRLSGTLGTYRLVDESRAVRDLYDFVRTTDDSRADTRVGETIDMLVRSLDDRVNRAGRPDTP